VYKSPKNKRRDLKTVSMKLRQKLEEFKSQTIPRMYNHEGNRNLNGHIQKTRGIAGALDLGYSALRGL